ncbi:MAG: helix-turn-helix transcriptional regulator [Phycisphaerae bacterium]|nr:helix-turn-helix transcriptional regulator [Phycisphaerae bacterium]
MKRAAQIKLGDELRSARQATSLTQVELASRLGIQQSHVSEYETGKRRIYADVYRRWLEACRSSPPSDPPTPREASSF